MEGHKQGISCISKGSQNIFILNFIITTFDCQGGSQGRGISARAFALVRPGVAPPLFPIQSRYSTEFHFSLLYSISLCSIRVSCIPILSTRYRLFECRLIENHFSSAILHFRFIDSSIVVRKQQLSSQVNQINQSNVC